MQYTHLQDVARCHGVFDSTMLLIRRSYAGFKVGSNIHIVTQKFGVHETVIMNYKVG